MVTTILAFQGSHNMCDRLMSLHSPWIILDVMPNRVNTLLLIH